MQLLALQKKPLPNLKFFEAHNINDVTIHQCSDGYTRYTTGQFDSYKACLELKKELIKDNNLKDIWIRPTIDFEKLKSKK